MPNDLETAPSGLLYSCLSGLLYGVSGVNDNFKEYDKSLSGFLTMIGELDVDPIEQRMAYSRRFIDDLTGSSSYTLTDGIYRSVISQDTTFVLSTPEDTSILHEILITVKFTDVYYVTFKDASNNTIDTTDLNDWDQNDVVEYLCRWESFLNKWVVMPMKVGEAS